ncbi:MAG: hypothetical protein AAF937_08435 [Planctomycetota bacterium]
MPDAWNSTDQLKAYLVDRDVPCPGCGYNLRGVAEPVCPECGTLVDIEEWLVNEQHLRQYRKTLSGLIVGWITNAVLPVGILVLAVYIRGRVPPEDIAVMLVVPVVISVSILGLALPYGRAWFCARQNAVQLTLSRIAWISPLLAIPAWTFVF